MVTKNGIKCNGCGKFIAYKDIIEGKVEYEFTPESEFGHEKHDHYCINCQEIDYNKIQLVITEEGLIVQTNGFHKQESFSGVVVDNKVSNINKIGHHSDAWDKIWFKFHQKVTNI